MVFVKITSIMSCASLMVAIVVGIMSKKPTVANVHAMKRQEFILIHYKSVRNEIVSSKLYLYLDTVCPIFITVRGDWYQELSDNQCVISWLGDGICQKVNNHVLCHFDGGDCCVRTEFSTKLCSDCVCLHGSKY